MDEIISRRDRFSVLILTGLLAHHGVHSKNSHGEWAEMAVEQADELIKYLDSVKVTLRSIHHHLS